MDCADAQGSQAAQEQQRAPQSPTAPPRPSLGPSQPKAAPAGGDVARLQAELEQVWCTHPAECAVLITQGLDSCHQRSPMSPWVL